MHLSPDQQDSTVNSHGLNIFLTSNTSDKRVPTSLNLARNRLPTAFLFYYMLRICLAIFIEEGGFGKLLIQNHPGR